jgi:DGQHR domain-containing protein
MSSLKISRSLRVVQGDITFYLASLPAADLFQICAGLRQDTFRQRLIEESDGESADEEARHFVDSVSTSVVASDVKRIESEPYEETEPFQRLIDETRVRKIATYLDEDFALIPNSIILAVRNSATCDIGKGDAAPITLEWSEEVPTNIIDGQHRVEALRLFLGSDPKAAAEFHVPVCILVDLPYYAQANMFAVINGRQKQVSRSRIYDLLGYMPIKDPTTKERAYQGEMAIHRFCHHVVRVLNTSSKSPWHDRIKMRGSGEGLVTQAAFVTDLAQLVAPRRDTPKLSRFPVFFPYFQSNDLVGLAKTCVIYFLGIARAWENVWQADENLKTSLFGKSNGIAVMFLILHDLAILAGGPEHLTVDDVKARWAKAPAERINNPPTGGSRGYQLEWYRAMMAKMIGADFESQVAAASPPIRQRLREIGGLYR